MDGVSQGSINGQKGVSWQAKGAIGVGKGL